jgi:hypothetical protein
MPRRRILIDYRGSDGELTRREISGIVRIDPNAIEALCHLQGARRTFVISRILEAVDAETGELLENPWAALPHAGSEPPTVPELLGPLVPAVLVLENFAKRTRGFAKRERAPVLDFIARHSQRAELTPADLEKWLVGVWAGDATNQADHLKRLPVALRAECRAVALQIARGSGRRPIAPEVMELIEAEFPR